MNKLTVGQTIWLEPLNNAARRSTDLIEVKITKVGRTYFEVEPSFYGKFHINSMTQVSNYTADYTAHVSLQDVQDKIEVASYRRKIVDKLTHQYGSLDVNVIRKIADLLNIK